MLFSLTGDLSDFWWILIDSFTYIINSLRQELSEAFASALTDIPTLDSNVSCGFNGNKLRPVKIY